ncbi:MAG: hypothetical protein HYV26_23220 [Candidatus Hydrogenedentes bacterium]|nr:hypothetical protein [Candidatus Hydrogenedentota bacterium]
MPPSEEVLETLKTAGRGADNNFAQDELLYRRFMPEQLLKSGRIDLTAFKFPDIRDGKPLHGMSVNRQKGGGNPEYLLLDHSGWGVFQIAVNDIPTPQYDAGKPYDFRPIHLPEKNNYFHSEIRCFDVAGLVDPEKPLSKEVLDRWRLRMQMKARLAIRPQQCTSE